MRAVLNDYMRSSAERLNIPLETSSGPLSMADLSRVYRALLQDRK